ncbi:MAG TPA: hypothetical protein VF815_37300 [Myxococcaceae bacterium]|jgi:hypothetical protein
MPVRHLTTRIWLPPRTPEGSVVREFLRRAFEEYRWFRPTRFGRAFIDKPLDPERIDYDSLTTYYEELYDLTVAARTDRDFLLIFTATNTNRIHAGGITWETSVKEASRRAWRAAHQTQIMEVMQLFGSPLAQTGEDSDLERKTRRLVPSPDGVGQVLTFTVNDYSEGLPGLLWRNFFGPPFVRMFGERMASLPAEFKQELDGGIVLVQPYELPTQAGTPEGDARERQLIAHLGPECFYDHERNLKPSRVPEVRSGLNSF